MDIHCLIHFLSKHPSSTPPKQIRNSSVNGPKTYLSQTKFPQTSSQVPPPRPSTSYFPRTDRKMLLGTHHQHLSRRNQLHSRHLAAQSRQNTEQVCFVFGGEGLGEYIREDFATGFFEERGVVFEGYGVATEVTNHAH